jgi:catechol 2,3-dioxygenase-like lactoylglutathione lyase family enzyme
MYSNEKIPVSFRMENITPILSVKNIAKSKAFYIDILGFKEAAWGDDNFTSINRDKTGLYLCKGAQGNPGTWVWFGFEGDIFSLYNDLKTRGVIIKSPPKNYSWAMEMLVEDPDGHILRFGTDPNDDEPFLDR